MRCQTIQVISLIRGINFDRFHLAVSLVTCYESAELVLKTWRRPCQLEAKYHSFCSVVSWFNSMVNPIVYCFLNKRFRNEYAKVLHCSK